MQSNTVPGTIRIDCKHEIQALGYALRTIAHFINSFLEGKYRTKFLKINNLNSITRLSFVNKLFSFKV